MIFDSVKIYNKTHNTLVITNSLNQAVYFEILRIGGPFEVKPQRGTISHNSSINIKVIFNP